MFQNIFIRNSISILALFYIFGLHLFYKVVGSQVEMVSRAIESRLQLTSILRAWNVELECDMTNVSHHLNQTSHPGFDFIHSFWSKVKKVTCLDPLSWDNPPIRLDQLKLVTNPWPSSGQTPHPPSSPRWHADTNITVWGSSPMGEYSSKKSLFLFNLDSWYGNNP